ncbi:MAG TPA: sigma-54 dependent transcriptional regulator [Syntrophorhabdales bacterium]|nr:sigma-54 dependent transcriptional regulator [Syntrophorhabdales bacterium]
MIRVLIVDDETRLVEAFSKKLTHEGMSISTASSAAEALALVKGEPFDVCVLDIRLTDMDGIGLLAKLKEMQPLLEVIMLTGYASVDSAIRSMKLGAYDYLTKPTKLSVLSKVIVKAHEKKALREKNIILEEQLHRAEFRDAFIGESRPIAEVKRLIGVVASTNTPVLIVGETGTGKELVARAIHDMSHRAHNPFVAVNSSTFQEAILESELFGHKKGAFTGADADKLGLLEIANGGTFFMDEVGDMGPTIQAKLLRVLEAGVFRKVGDTREISVDVRFICATNRDLDREVDEKKFRKDLFYRLNTFTIAVPPLRERKEDIPLLVDYFLGKQARGGVSKTVSPDTMQALLNYRWPGNVRELANVLERAVLLSGSRSEVALDLLPENVLANRLAVDDRKDDHHLRRGVVELTAMEKTYIEDVLRSVGGNKSKAARLLGISRKRLYSKINES